LENKLINSFVSNEKQFLELLINLFSNLLLTETSHFKNLEDFVTFFTYERFSDAIEEHMRNIVSSAIASCLPGPDFVTIAFGSDPLTGAVAVEIAFPVPYDPVAVAVVFPFAPGVAVAVA